MLQAAFSRAGLCQLEKWWDADDSFIQQPPTVPPHQRACACGKAKQPPTYVPPHQRGVRRSGRRPPVTPLGFTPKTNHP